MNIKKIELKSDQTFSIKNMLLGGLVAIIIIFLVLHYNYILTEYIVGSKNVDYSDSFGLSTAIFTALAFIGVIFTVTLQSQELKLQRQELADTRKVLKGQEKQLQAQSDTLTKQNFENTFFELLRAHNMLRDNIKFTYSWKESAQYVSQTVNGYEAFRYLYTDTSGAKSIPKIHNGSLDGSQTLVYQVVSLIRLKRIEGIMDGYEVFYESYRHMLSSYFRSLYSVIKFIDGSDVKNKKVYSDIVRAHLSDYEILILFYNGLSQNGVKIKPLIERYSLLKHINQGEMLDQYYAYQNERVSLEQKKIYPENFENLIDKYDKTAFS